MSFICMLPAAREPFDWVRTLAGDHVVLVQRRDLGLEQALDRLALDLQRRRQQSGLDGPRRHLDRVLARRTGLRPDDRVRRRVGRISAA